MQPTGKGEQKIYIFGLYHMTKMTAMLINGLKTSNLLFQNHWTDCLENWYVAVGLKYYKVYKNNNSDLFNGNVKLSKCGV